MKTKNINYIFIILGVLVLQGRTLGQIKIGDNLGNHKAVKELDMNSQKIINAAGLIFGASTFTNNSIQLELTGADKALLLNRVASLSAINSPIDGMAVYNSSDNKFYVRQGGSWMSFTSATDAVTSLTVSNIGSAPNSKGISLNTSKGDVILTLQPADNTNPGIITTGAQTFGGDKIFAGNSSFANVAITGIASFTGLSVSNNVNDVVAVFDATGNIKKSSLLAGSINKLNVPIPIGTSALFVSDNMIITITLTVNGIKQDDGVVVNFSTADLSAFNGLSILNAFAIADNTIKVSIADSRNPADPLYGAVAIDNKNLVVTYLHK